MLLALTYKCFEDCSHCMVNASPKGMHMSWDTLRAAKNVIVWSGTCTVVISGGEITTHPDFVEMVKSVANLGVNIMLESNGTWIGNAEIESKVKEVLNLPNVRGMQISSHKKYYLSYEKIIDNIENFTKLSPKIKVLTDWQGELGTGSNPNGTHLVQLSRAAVNHPAKPTGVPGCMSLITRERQLDRFMDTSRTFKKLILWNEFQGRFCKPLIDPAGNIRVGETPFCHSIGNVNDIHSPEELSTITLTNISKFRPSVHCNKCKAMCNVNPQHIQLLQL